MSGGLTSRTVEFEFFFNGVKVFGHGFYLNGDKVKIGFKVVAP